MSAARRTRPATDIALIAAFAALIAACAIAPALHINSLVPITLQTFGVLLSGAVLGAWRGFLACCLYIAAGAAGLPIFSGGAAGLAVLQGPTAGYLLGFPLAAACCGFLVQRLPHRSLQSVLRVFLAGLVSSAVFIHTLGMLGLMWRADFTLHQAFRADWVFWFGDVLKNLAMALVATAVHRAFPDLLRTPRVSEAPVAAAKA